MKAVAGRFAAVVLMSTLLAALVGLVPVLLERGGNASGPGTELAVFGRREFGRLTESNLPDFLLRHRTALRLARAELAGDVLEIRAEAGSMTEREAYGDAWKLIRHCLISGASLAKVRLVISGTGFAVRIEADRARLADDPGMNNPLGLPPEEYLKEVFDVVPEP